MGKGVDQSDINPIFNVISSNAVKILDKYVSLPVDSAGYKYGPQAYRLFYNDGREIELYHGQSENGIYYKEFEGRYLYCWEKGYQQGNKWLIDSYTDKCIESGLNAKISDVRRVCNRTVVRLRITDSNDSSKYKIIDYLVKDGKMQTIKNKASNKNILTSVVGQLGNAKYNKVYIRESVYSDSDPKGVIRLKIMDFKTKKVLTHRAYESIELITHFPQYIKLIRSDNLWADVFDLKNGMVCKPKDMYTDIKRVGTMLVGTNTKGDSFRLDPYSFLPKDGGKVELSEYPKY